MSERRTRGGGWLTCAAILLSLSVSPPDSAGIGGRFALERLTDESWTAEYCFDRPVSALRFERPIEGMRESHWEAASGRFRLAVADDGAAELRRRDGRDFSCGTLRLRTYTRRPQANYYAFSSFSDGGVSVYTGYLVASAFVEGEWRESALDASYRGREGERVVARDPDALVEQFVYVGRQDVLETPGAVAVVDPAVPPEARGRVLETIPAAGDLLAEEFGFRPDDPYQLFMATHLEAGENYSVKGGTLPDQVLFTLKGRGVVPMMEREPFRFPRFAAHEVMHLWQYDHWSRSIGAEAPWVHEGGAEALALEILRRTGVYDEKAYGRAWRELEAECRELLRETSVRGGPAEGFFRIVYACGALVYRLVGEALVPYDPGAGILELWRAMAERPPEVRRGPGEPLVFAALRELGFDSEERAAVHAFLNAETEEPGAEIQRVRRALR